MNFSKKTVKHLMQMKKQGESITMLTAYDYSIAKILDGEGIDMILVGDSLANVFQGHETTLSVTLEEMIYHAKAVLNGVKQAFVVVDMPFGSYQINQELALANAIEILKKTNAQAIKLEGGIEVAKTITCLVEAGIPVMGHLGLTPQSIHQLGSYEVQAVTNKSQDKILSDAIALEAAGCFSIVLEKIPANIAENITHTLTIPVIGIGAGNGCDGQVLVINDLLGLDQQFKPKFVRKYLNLNELISNSVKEYINDVKNKQFPGKNESY